MRSAILESIRANRPAARPHPGILAPRAVAAAAESRFAANANLSKSKVLPLGAGESLVDLLAALHPHAEKVAHGLAGPLAQHLEQGEPWASAIAIGESTPITVLAEIHLAVLPARLAVVENGACWVAEADMGHRALPFSTEHLVLVVERSTLVETMHEAYAQVQCDGSFGVFIAGPSKTADIEQSLVIGAQGPRSLAVVLV